jgi:hypothetical protein
VGWVSYWFLQVKASNWKLSAVAERPINVRVSLKYLGFSEGIFQISV